MKDIDAWFTDIRKRIGWNELRTTHFATRSELIAAATLFSRVPRGFKPWAVDDTLLRSPQKRDLMQNSFKWKTVQENYTRDNSSKRRWLLHSISLSKS
ncbi:hypothetical protein BDZ97DRAFT_375731 [Flammula alnicola]|nr:hypothetical protein BDZ97DRAFT_375731 [Flammula alnicola]